MIRKPMFTKRIRQLRRERGFIINPYSFGAGGPTDPNFASVSLLLHGDGSDGSTTFTDNSPNAFTITANGNAQIDTAQSKFGGSSMLFDGTGDFLTAPDNADFDMGSGDFTIEQWVRIPSAPTAGNVYSFIAKRASTAVRSPFMLYMDENLKIGMLSSSATVWAVNYLSPSAAFTANTWYFVSMTRSGSNWYLHVDGTRVTTATSSHTVLANAAAVSIGAAAADGSAPVNGWLEDVRVTKGVARYSSSNYTAPASAFPNS